MPDDLIRSVNLRDLGGYRTADGATVRHGLVFRSAALSALEGEALAAVRALGIRMIIDLRHNAERAAYPTPWEAMGCADYWCRDHSDSGADLAPLLRDPAMTADDCRGLMTGLYRTLPYALSEAYRRLFRGLVEGGTPLLFHCAAGKDRTGVAAALILGALGVPRDVITEEYGLTAAYDLFASPSIRDRPPLSPARLATVTPLLMAETGYLDAMFETLIERDGSVRGYLLNTLGLAPDDITTLRDNLLHTPG
ncbi:tyrosine-protein phosphatase [Sphingomonas solaris]|nr:tyrosine-protein phosphatase [Sphingomonas solaris]